MSQQSPIGRVRQFIRHGCAAVLLLFASPLSVVFGQDQKPSAVENALERLEKALQHEQGLAPETKDAIQNLVGALRAERAQAAQARQQVPAKPPEVSKGLIAEVVDEYLTARPPTREKMAWEKVLDRLALYGDLRLRHESDFELDDRRDRHRQRVRLRLGANYQLTDEILLGARITTGNPADPNSPHVTLGNVFHSFDISLDRAFLTYQPEWIIGARLTAGKFSHPFYQNPVYGELVWDADVQPEGIVGGYTLSDVGLLERLDLAVGEYTLLEQATVDDAFASVFQISGRLRLADHLKGNLAVGYYLYSDATPDGSLTILGDNAGNATVDKNGDGQADDFRSRFGILNPIVGFTYDGRKFPLMFSGEYILNTRAHGDRDQGWAVGAALGRAEKQGDWRLYYQWQVVEQDAVFSPFSQDDFLFQTNHHSHIFGINYQWRDNIGLHLWGLVSQRDKTFSGAATDSDQTQWRLRSDLNIRF